MGAFTQSMFRFFIVPLLLVICESFPYVKQGRVEIINVDNNRNKIVSGDAGNIHTDFNSMLQTDLKESLLSSLGAFSYAEASANSKANDKALGYILESRTENMVSDILNKHSSFNKDHKHKDLTADSISVGTSADILSTSKLDNKKFSINQLDTIMSNLLSTAKHKIDDKTTSRGATKDLTQTPNVSKREKHLTPELRQRRSYLDLDLEDIFADDVGDGIFGAHTTPCEYADRHYCLNGGTCIYMPSLDIKGCRCVVGYAGTRCDTLDQAYLIALLTGEYVG